jgi:hypothetical protein
MVRTSPQRMVPVLLLVAALPGFSGCSWVPRASVSGTVTHNGLALTHKVSLTFIGSDNVPRTTQTDDNGAFALSNLPVGEVSATAVSIPDGGPKARPRPKFSEKPTERPPEPPPLEQSEVPPKYGDAANPLLKFDLKEGNNYLPIDLK